MGFLELNRRKIFNIFILDVSIWTIVGLIVYISERGGMNQPPLPFHNIKVIIILMFTFSMMFFMIYLIGGWTYFYKARRLLSNILALKLFDNNTHVQQYIYQRWKLFYTQEAVFGFINGYPVIANVNTSISRSSTTNFNVYVFIVKFNTVRPEKLQFEIRNENIPLKLKESVIDFISGLKNKGYEMGNILPAAAADMII